MKILLLGFNENKTSYSAKRLVAELKKRGHTVNYMSWKGLVFSFTQNGVSIQRVNGTDLKYYDYIIPKAPIFTKKTENGALLSHLYRHYLLVVKYINQHNKHALNEKTTKKIPFYDKLLQHYLLSQAGLPVVSSRLYTGLRMPASVYKKFKKPYIIKGIEGRAGRQVFLIKKSKKEKEIIKNFELGKLLVQKYMPTKHDYRIIVIGNKVMGAMKRTAKKGEFRANFSLGGSIEKVSVSKEMELLAIRAAKVFNAEFAGVDILKYKNAYYILEVNIFPGFEGFEKATEVNIAKELVAYIEKKYLWSIQTEFTKKEKKDMFLALYKIEQENLEKPLTKKGFMKTILERELIVIKKENEPIAYLTHYQKNTTRRITRWGILPKYRGQRIGRRMLRQLVALAKQNNDKKINSVLPAENKKRQLTYKRAGFKKTEKLEKHFTDGTSGLVFEYIIHPTKRIKGAGLTKTNKLPAKKIIKRTKK